MKLTIHSDGFEGWAKRARARAGKIDRKERVEPEMTITFEDPLAMADVLTKERLRLIKTVKQCPASVTSLASTLKRDPKAVRRDVGKLERVGVLRTRQQVNPGHGKIKIVEPVAKKYSLTVAF
jgi:predicted transcriptional regulator